MSDADVRPGGLRLLVTVTFNPNQLRAHLLPLIALEEVDSIALVADAEPPLLLPKVRAYVPSPASRRTLGRAGAKLALCRRLARRERFDWVIGFNFVPHGFNAVQVGKWSGARSLYHMIGGEREWLGGGYSGSNSVLSRLPRPVPRLERWLLARMSEATLVATMGPADREQIVALGLDPERVVVIPPSTDVQRFRPSDGDRPYDAVCVAALIGLKRIEDLIDAAAALRPRHPAARYAVAGEGPLRDALERRADAVAMGDRFEFLGQVDRVESVYEAARTFVLPSEHEGLPIGVLDAMAAGVPVIASNVGEVPSAVRDGVNGLLFDVGDVPALARHLDTVLSDGGLARRLGAAARRTAVNDFSVEAVAARYRALLLDS